MATHTDLDYGAEHITECELFSRIEDHNTGKKVILNRTQEIALLKILVTKYRHLINLKLEVHP